MFTDIRTMTYYFVLGIIMCYICYTDWKERKIYNNAIIAIIACAVWFNIDNMTQVVNGLLISFVFFIPFWIMRGLGGGDFKLLMALGASIGVINSFIVFLLAAIPCIIYVAIKSYMKSREELMALAGDVVFSCKMVSIGQLKTAVDISRREKVRFGCWLCGSYYAWVIIAAFGGCL